MTHHTGPEHFKGKSVYEHLKDARQRGAIAAGEVHGKETSSTLLAFISSSKDTIIALSAIWIICTNFSFERRTTFLVLISFAFGWILWKGTKKALVSWEVLERLHRLIEEERYEIQHHRDQERTELAEIYKEKGFSGELLDHVVDVLMADDNRLLHVMLEEEMGLRLESFEHPLKQAFGAASGVLFVSALLISGYLISPNSGLLSLGLVLMAIFASVMSKKQGNRQIQAIIWNCSVFIFAVACVYFLTKLLS